MNAVERAIEKEILNTTYRACKPLGLRSVKRIRIAWALIDAFRKQLAKEKGK